MDEHGDRPLHNLISKGCQPANTIMEKLSSEQVAAFISNGFARVENAFTAEIAEQCREILWKATGVKPDDPGSWSRAVINIGELSDWPFRLAANTPLLLNAFDQLAGAGNWSPRTTMGSFPIRFPSREEPTDTGWHVDASFPGDNPHDYMDWRINIRSKGRALLMLFLFSDVGESEAPTRIRVGSHMDVARILEPCGEMGLSFMELAGKLDISKDRLEEAATGPAGTVFLCHPFIVHAAQAHRGNTPKFMAQPPLLPLKEFNLERPDHKYCPVELAILQALEKNN